MIEDALQAVRAGVWDFLGNGKSGKYKLDTQYVPNNIEFRFYDPAAQTVLRNRLYH